MSSDASHSPTHASRDSHPSSGKPPLKWKVRGDIDDEGSNSSVKTRVRDASDGFCCSGVYGYPSYKHHRDRDASTCDSESSPCRVSSLSSSFKYIGLYFGRSRLGKISSSSGRRVKRIDPYMLQGEVFTIPSRAPRSQVVWMNENHQWAYSTKGFHEVFEGHVWLARSWVALPSPFLANQGLLLMAFPRVAEESARSAALSVRLAEESLMTFSSGRFFGPLLLAKAFTFTRTYNDSPNICWLEFELARGISDHASSSVIVLESMLHFIWRSMTARLRRMS
ncbi:hypothetical protein ACFE04_014104 [Oxalis oulophora]